MTLRPYSSTVQANFRDVMGTPAAPEAFDDQTPLMPVVDVSLQKDATSTLLVSNDLPKLRSYQTQINATFSSVSTGATIYTVTTGKTLFIFGLNISNQSAATSGAWSILVNGVTVLRGGRQFATEGSLTGGILFTATSGQAVTIAHAWGVTSATGCIWGYEV